MVHCKSPAEFNLISRKERLPWRFRMRLPVFP